MIRPSMLTRAEKCGYAPVLAEQYPEQGDAAERGTAIHAEIANYLIHGLIHGDQRVSPESIAATEWLDLETTGQIAVEKHVSLVDIISMETITEGTPDVIVTNSNEVVVVDWKTGRSENVADVDDNLQLIAYGLATCNGAPFRCVLVFLDGDKDDARWSRTFEPAEHAALLARVKAAATREPIPHPGEHCGSCYQRRYCHAWQARETQALAVVAPGAVEVTTENASKLAEMIGMVDGDNGWLATAKTALYAFIRSGGEVVKNGKRASFAMVAGKESADLSALKADGLTKYVKQGKPFERLTWKKV